MLQKLQYKLFDGPETEVITSAGDQVRTDRKYGAVEFIYNADGTEIVSIDESNVSFTERTSYMVYCALNRTGVIPEALSDEGFDKFLNNLEFVKSLSMNEEQVEDQVLNPTAGQ